METPNKSKSFKPESVRTVTKNRSLKTEKIIYWITTGLLALFILPGIFFLNSPMAIEGTKHLGMPYWFHIELGIGKFIGGVILILPMIPKRIKEWAYVAFGIDSLSATIGLLSVDGLKPMSFAPLIFFALLVISYIYFHKLKSSESI
jgi:hypothetical protein